MFKNKMLFILKRYKYNNNKISISKNFSFLPIISFAIIRLFKFIAKNESDEDSFNINFSKDISNRKRITSIFRIFKKKMIKKSDFIDIAKINVLIYYYLARNKKNKLFSLLFFLIMNEIYNTLYEPFSPKTL